MRATTSRTRGSPWAAVTASPGLLSRSEGIQGRRAEIDDLRHQWQSRCASGGEAGDEGDDGKPGKGHGRSKGKGGGQDG